MINHSMMVDW